MVVKDLVIGCADLYDWPNVKAWAKSIIESGFKGDIVLLCYRVTEDLVLECQKLGIQCYDCNFMPDGSPIVHDVQGKNTISHQLRFYHIWKYLQDNNYFKVIITDIRDVIFQKDPSNFKWVGSDIFYPSECISFGNEPWNKNNLIQAFPEFYTEKINDWTVYNVGTVIGFYKAMKLLSKMIYIMGNGRTIPNDQAAFNIIANEVWRPQLNTGVDNMGWACQCGVVLDPEKSHLLPYVHEKEFIPTIKDGKVLNHYGQPYFLVHQYDRNPELKKCIEERYA